MPAPRIIPIRQLAPGSAAEEAGARLERAGFMRMMAIGEPRLTEFVTRYKARGYEVELVPCEEADAGAEAGCGTRFEGNAPRVEGATIYVRKRTQQTDGR